ncbi:MAG TPA: phospholipid carrier-dependent glycosyltransferase [Actinomycetaceae bacterium]|nr:phospholipid carrier-dependent glycosyltransferase [Actinomycetaceae bacterium]
MSHDDASAGVLTAPVETRPERRTGFLPPAPVDRVWGWVGPLLVAGLAGVLRLVNLAHPDRLMFDETYYVKQAYSLLQLGYEGTWADDADEQFRDGDFSALSADAAYVVHPQVGKWLIAIGLRLFGVDNGVGWRFSAAVAGVISVLLLARITRRLLASTWLGMAAGGLLAVDGLHLTGSRIGLLDIFLSLFVLAALGAVVLDRDQQRRRLAAAWADPDGAASDPWGPRTGVRWWLVLAGVLLGIACGVKWSGIYAVAVFGVCVAVWDVLARRELGVRAWLSGGIVRGAWPAFLALVPPAAITYVAGWWSWFANPQAYLRQWAAEQWAAHGEVARSWLPNALNSWWEYHLRMWQFHNGLDTEHTYEAHPAGWLLQLRPTAFYWEGELDGCGAERCVAAITSVGNPVVWWVGVLALAVVAWAAIVGREWRAWVVLAGYAATYLPWFAYAHRTIFTFYTIALVPYVALAIVVALAWLGGLIPSAARTSEGAVTDGRGRTRVAWGAIATVCALAAVAALYFWPVWSGQTIPYEQWSGYMWLGSWV